MNERVVDRTFFSPTNSVVIGFDDNQNFVIFDDFLQVSYAQTVETKPVFQLGNKLQSGYTNGVEVFAGTIQIPANSTPSFYKLFSEWFKQMKKYIEMTHDFSDEQVNLYKIFLQSEKIFLTPELLPKFHMVIYNYPEYLPRNQDRFSMYEYVFYGIKFIETSNELSVSNGGQQVVLYRFTADYVSQTVKDFNIDELTIDEQKKEVTVLFNPADYLYRIPDLSEMKQQVSLGDYKLFNIYQEYLQKLKVENDGQ